MSSIIPRIPPLARSSLYASHLSSICLRRSSADFRYTFPDFHILQQFAQNLLQAVLYLIHSFHPPVFPTSRPTCTPLWNESYPARQDAGFHGCKTDFRAWMHSIPFILARSKCPFIIPHILQIFNSKSGSFHLSRHIICRFSPYPIRTSFPRNAKPYFLIRCAGIPRAPCHGGYSGTVPCCLLMAVLRKPGHAMDLYL